MAVERLQHEAVAAERDQHVGRVRVVLAVSRNQFGLGAQRLMGWTGEESDAGRVHGRRITRPGSIACDGQMPPGPRPGGIAAASAARGELRKPLDRDRSGRVIQRLLRGQFVEHRQGEAQRWHRRAAASGGPWHRHWCRAWPAPGLTSARCCVASSSRNTPRATACQRPSTASASICSCSHGSFERLAEAEVHLGDVDRLELALTRDLDDVAARLQVRQRRQLSAEFRRHALGLPVAQAGLVGRALRGRQDALAGTDVAEAVVVAPTAVAMSGIAPGRVSSQRVNERCSVQITCSASICTDSATLPSSASICAHSSRASSVSRVMVKALATSPGMRPVSSCMRSRKVAPMRLIVELVTAVAMISRFRRCCSIALAYFSCSGCGK